MGSRRFVVVGSRARTARDFTMDDLAGSAGRWDLLARCVQSALFVSHDLRRDTELVLVLLGPPSPPKTIRVSGALVQRLNPDERSTVALLSRALELPLPPSGAEVMSSQGVYVSRADLLAAIGGPGARRLVLLDEAGRHGGPERLPEAVGPDPTFVIGDDRGLTGDQLGELRARGAIELSLGPVSMHADHCIVVVHNLLDRAGTASAVAAAPAASAVTTTVSTATTATTAATTAKGPGGGRRDDR